MHVPRFMVICNVISLSLSLSALAWTQGQKKIIYYTSFDSRKRANAAYLVGSYMVSEHPMSFTTVVLLVLSLSLSLSLPLSLAHTFRQIIYHRRSPEEVLRSLGPAFNHPFPPFRDASAGRSTYNLTLHHCFSAISKVTYPIQPRHTKNTNDMYH